MYSTATNNGDIFSKWAALVPREKIAIGICSEGGCEYGPGLFLL